MSKIAKAFQNQKAFIAFVTGGDPDLQTTAELILRIDKAGADIIEIGIPFSDPVAEGPVIQKADERALSGGCTTDKIIDMLRGLRGKMEAALVFMTYINPVFAYGKDRFLQACRDCGVEGVIIPDLPFEEKDEIAEDCKKYGVKLISMIAPTSEARIEMIAKEAEGFLYCVSSMGVTGVRNSIETDLEAMIRQVKKVSSIPCAIGFGISTPEQAREMATIGDGVIVGSAIVERVSQYGKGAVSQVASYVKEMKAAIND